MVIGMSIAFLIYWWFTSKLKAGPELDAHPASPCSRSWRYA